MNKLDVIIGNNLSFLRERFGYTQGDMGRFLGISQPAYSKYEEGKTTVPPEALEKLAELYYVEEYDLMQDDKSLLQPSLVYAYRKQDGETAFEAIAKFPRIVKNYTLMSNEISEQGLA